MRSLATKLVAGSCIKQKGVMAVSKAWLVACVGLLATAAMGAPQAPNVRVRELGQYVGQVVSVKGRTGQILEAEETPGVHVFTLRDDYGDEVKVRTGGEYPVFGATYVFTGRPVDYGGRLYLEEVSRWQVYSLKRLLLILLGVVAGVGALLGLGLWARTRKPPLWGYARVVEGPGQGNVFALRGREVLIGRATDPGKGDVCLSDEDRQVSRIHGRLFWRRGTLYYHDCGNDGTGSTHGSTVDGVPVPRGGTVPLTGGRVLIRLGGQTVLEIVPPGVLESSGTVVAGVEMPEAGDVGVPEADLAEAGAVPEPPEGAAEDPHEAGTVGAGEVPQRPGEDGEDPHEGATRQA